MAVVTYLVFGGEAYEEAGGWGDFIAATPTQTDASVAILTRYPRADFEWGHIVDADTLSVVATWDDRAKRWIDI